MPVARPERHLGGPGAGRTEKHGANRCQVKAANLRLPGGSLSARISGFTTRRGDGRNEQIDPPGVPRGIACRVHGSRPDGFAVGLRDFGGFGEQRGVFGAEDPAGTSHRRVKL
jgi:hypothetical protein